MLLDLMMLMIYIILNVYIIFKSRKWIDRSFELPEKKAKTIKMILTIGCILASSTLLLWLVINDKTLAVKVMTVGNYWLGFFIEIVSFTLIFDLVQAIYLKIKKVKKADCSARFFRISGFLILAASLAFTAEGCISARNIKLKTYNISIDKRETSPKDLKAVLIADTHMGYSIGCEQIKKMVDMINASNPDVVLIAGDIFDNNYDALDHPEELARLYREIKSKYGVYAVWGNHDVKAKLVGGFTVGGDRMRDPRMDQFLVDSNIKTLNDEIVTLADDSIYLIGRKDGEETGDGSERKSIEELTKDLDPGKPVLAMNHEPVKLESYEKNHVDVLFSGHTHAGQTFPLFIMNPFVWKNAHGCVKIGDMYSFVTSGVGIYGPYMRALTYPEIMEINISFK